VLYICIPVYNEAPTIGVLLWRIRATFQEHAREYELVVYDDGSTDATAEVLEPYTKVLPLTILSGRPRRGYAAAVDALCRHVAAHTRYPRRDAMVLMQGDFTDRPEHIPELVKRFEGGADIVATERSWAPKDPTPARRLLRLAPWLLRPFVRMDGIADVTSGYRLVRISLLRDLLRERGDAPLVTAAGWAANAELLLALAPHARRIESVPVEPRYDVRPRESRLRPAADAFALARFGWGARTLAQRARATPRAVAAPAPSRPADAPRDAVPAPDVAEAPVLALDDAAVGGVAAASRRRKRPRREPRQDDAAAPIAPDAVATGEDRPPREPGRRKRRPTPTPPSEADVGAPPIDAAPSALTTGDEPAESRRRRRARRAEPRPADEPSPADATEAPEPLDGGVEAVEGEAAPRKSRRSRRSRKRRDAARPGEANAAAGGEEAGPERSAEAGEPAGFEAAPDGSDGAPAEGTSAEGAPRTGRRSRRGRRRGGRSGPASAEPGADAAPSDGGRDAAPIESAHHDGS